MALAEHDEVRKIERYKWYLSGVATVLLAAGVGILIIISFGAVILPPAIEVIPERSRPFGMPTCPGDSIGRTVTYVINRPTVLEISGAVYDLEEGRSLPAPTVLASRPEPYTIRKTTPYTFTTPALEPGRYEWQIAVTAKGQNSVTAWWFVNFEVAQNCPPMEPTEAAP